MMRPGREPNLVWLNMSMSKNGLAENGPGQRQVPLNSGLMNNGPR